MLSTTADGRKKTNQFQPYTPIYYITMTQIGIRSTKKCIDHSVVVFIFYNKSCDAPIAK